VTPPRPGRASGASIYLLAVSDRIGASRPRTEPALFVVLAGRPPWYLVTCWLARCHWALASVLIVVSVSVRSYRLPAAQTLTSSSTPIRWPSAGRLVAARCDRSLGTGRRLADDQVASSSTPRRPIPTPGSDLSAPHSRWVPRRRSEQALQLDHVEPASVLAPHSARCRPSRSRSQWRRIEPRCGPRSGDHAWKPWWRQAEQFVEQPGHAGPPPPRIDIRPSSRPSS